MNLAQQAAALVLLRKHDADHACAPLRRSVLEHAAYLVWLAEREEDAVDELNSYLQGELRGLAKSADEAGFSISDQARSILEATLAAEVPDIGRHRIMNVLKQADPSGLLTAIWRSESGYTHPSVFIACLYWQEVDGGFRLSKKPRLEGDRQTVAACLLALYCGALAFDRLMVDSPWRGELRAVGDELGLPTELHQ